MDQPELGSTHVGFDGVTVGLSYRWELGWSLRVAARLSGASEWQERTYQGLDAAEAHARVQDVLADLLGLL